MSARQKNNFWPATNFLIKKATNAEEKSVKYFTKKVFKRLIYSFEYTVLPTICFINFTFVLKYYFINLKLSYILITLPPNGCLSLTWPA